MVSKGKKITVLDASGMLTQEALLGYVYGGLSPETHAEVEQLLARNEMYADLAEGLRHIPTRADAEKVIYELNEDVAARSGSKASVPGISENVGDFFWTYRRVAAVVGTVMLLSAAVLTFALLKVSNPEMAMNKELQKDKLEVAAETPPLEQSMAEAPATISDSTRTIAVLDENNVRDAEFSEKDIDAVMQTGGALPGLSTGISSADNKKNEARDKKEEKQPVTGAVQTQKKATTDTIANQNLAIADDAEFDKKSKERNEDLMKEEQGYVADEVIMQSKKETLSNTTTTTDSYYKNIPLATAEQMPVFPGGDAALIQYIRDNKRYPEKLKESNVEGTVYLSFVIGTTGKVKDIVVLKGVHKEINAEAIRLIANMPKWEPGKQGGKPVAVQLYQTIEFKIE